MPASDICLFALGGAREFGQQVAAALCTGLCPHEERDFEDGEHKARPLINVRGRDVYVIQPLHGNDTHSVNDMLVRLLMFIGTLGDASAARVTAVLPYLCYARKERKTQPRDPVSSRYVAAMFEAVGTDRVVALDVHNLAAFQNAHRCHTDHIEANGLFVRHFAEQLADQPVVVVSPDAGGVKRAERFRQGLASAMGGEPTLAFMEKHRGGGTMRGGALVGEVSDRQVLIIDDLVASGGTLAHAARVCRERGATAVHAAVTHGVFTRAANQALAEPALEQLVITNSLPHPQLTDPAVLAKLTVLDIAPLFAHAIAAIHSGGSVVDLLAV